MRRTSVALFVALASLSVLKLQHESRLSLNDTVRSRAPDVAFSNPWEATDPVRLVHVLEHTAGFDDVLLCEYASNDPTPLTLAEGLALHPASRTSRWRPGTRVSYSNSGPAVAAYVVEKVSGMRFEDYVTEQWFRPCSARRRPSWRPAGGCSVATTLRFRREGGAQCQSARFDLRVADALLGEDVNRDRQVEGVFVLLHAHPAWSQERAVRRLPRCGDCLRVR
jgi:CubicO group peptidase (beta-lactamase class C family)